MTNNVNNHPEWINLKLTQSLEQGKQSAAKKVDMIIGEFTTIIPPFLAAIEGTDRDFQFN